MSSYVSTRKVHTVSSPSLSSLSTLGFFSSSDEEDDVISYHDLVVILHARESGSDLGLLEWSGAALVDVSHQSVHAYRLSVGSTEDLQQRSFELLQPAEHTL